MTESQPEMPEYRPSPDIESIRKRPAMWVGSRGFFGFIHYLVSAFDLLFQNGATFIEVEVSENPEELGDNYSLTSDAQIPVRVNEEGRLEPFEDFGKMLPGHAPDGVILMALSDEFVLTMTDGEQETYLECDSGLRKLFSQSPAPNSELKVQLKFRPEYPILSVWEISPAVLHSYFRRNACLFPGVSLRIKSEDEVTEYRSERGIRDFFDAIALPYQIMHHPIHLLESEDNLKVEAVFVFHSWSEHHIWSFMNKGRVPDGGTHEAGMLDAIGILSNVSTQARSNGILAVLAVEYPHATFEGCIKARIGNPELREKVATLLSRGLQKWMDENEEEVEYLISIERFQFVGSW